MLAEKKRMFIEEKHVKRGTLYVVDAIIVELHVHYVGALNINNKSKIYF